MGRPKEDEKILTFLKLNYPASVGIVSIVVASYPLTRNQFNLWYSRTPTPDFDYTIVTETLKGKTAETIAKMVKVHPQTVHQRLRKFYMAFRSLQNAGRIVAREH